MGSGSETFVGTLARSLKKLGHSVTIYTHNNGWYGEMLKADGFEVWGKVLLHTNFDFVHFQHNETVHEIYDKLKHLPKLFMSHGILHGLEMPPDYNKYPMDLYIGSSEEVLSNCMNKVIKSGGNYNPKGIVFRNVIDTDKFNTDVKINSELKNVLVVSNYMQGTPNFVNLIREICNYKKLNLEMIGDVKQKVKNVIPYIEQADLCIGIGRCMLEAMSMSRNVILFDYQGLDGFMDNENYLEVRKYNFSGRRYKNKEVSGQDLIDCFNKYSVENGKINRQLILDNHDSKKIVKEYINKVSNLIL